VYTHGFKTLPTPKTHMLPSDLDKIYGILCLLPPKSDGNSHRAFCSDQAAGPQSVFNASRVRSRTVDDDFMEDLWRVEKAHTPTQPQCRVPVEAA
jgi:hypothetical protein